METFMGDNPPQPHTDKSWKTSRGTNLTLQSTNFSVVGLVHVFNMAKFLESS